MLPPMRLLLYEWCCSGGLRDGDAALAAEGRMMLEALAADAARANLEIAVLRATAAPLDLPSRARRIEVEPGHDRGPLEAAARAADWTIVVAPESDGILLDRVRAVREAGGRLLAPADQVIKLAADKQATITRLAGRGIPVPPGRSLKPGEPVPDGFHLPAIRKARGGCGCEALAVLRGSATPPAEVPTRVELLVVGTPVGVSLICGPEQCLALPPMRQQFTAGDTPRYLGGEPLADPSAAARAVGLARRAAAAVAADGGWLGVDLILGSRADGRDDRILEINPRLTSSFVGLSRLVAGSLVAAMIEAADGGRPTLPAAAESPGRGRFRIPSAAPPREPLHAPCQ
jgi:predicted ATP-grasp superfamily ATP-dependent carboligase